MTIKRAALICALSAAAAGCSAISDRGPNDGGHELSSKGYTVRCDAEPRNQPGCYQKTGSSWNFGALKFNIGN